MTEPQSTEQAIVAAEKAEADYRQLAMYAAMRACDQTPSGCMVDVAVDVYLGALTGLARAELKKSSAGAMRLEPSAGAGLTADKLAPTEIERQLANLSARVACLESSVASLRASSITYGGGPLLGGRLEAV